MTHHYPKLALNLALSAVIMYLVMYTMIDGLADFYHNLNTTYMTLMMVSPMAILMLLMMGSMYSDARLNLVLYAVFALVFIAAFAAMRTQALVHDEQFLRSMIPHHSGAVLMCEKSTIADPEIVRLCGQIVQSQKAEIAQMKGMLERY
jgi:uncharacterized protein (DUF305 family)